MWSMGEEVYVRRVSASEWFQPRCDIEWVGLERGLYIELWVRLWEYNCRHPTVRC